VLLGPPDRVAEKLTAAATVLAHLTAESDGRISAKSSSPILDVRVPEAPAVHARLDR
jgi:hypothetical protein